MVGPEPPQPPQPAAAPPPPGYNPSPAPPPAGYGPPPGYGQTGGHGVPGGYGQPPGPPGGYGQPGYPYPGPPGAPPPRAGRRIGLIIAIVAAAVALLLLVACGLGAFLWYRQAGGGEGEDLPAIINYRETNPGALSPDHLPDGTALSYPMRPPAGGPHYNRWQNCNGDVYPAPIEDGHAVHSLEHGAVWITYREGLPPDEVARLADRVRGQSYLMMSPYRSLDSTVTLQAWGYQLIAEDVDDERIDEFIRQYRQTATIEPGATCGGGITTTR